jgi:carboxypeptidase family protein
MRKIGSSLVLLAALAMPAVFAGKKKGAEPYALVAGTVFREPGFALAGAEVVIVPNPAEGQAPVKIKKLEAHSDARGEFAVRVPPVPMRYTIHVSAGGYQPEEKSVSVEGEQRADATFLLRAESK